MFFDFEQHKYQNLIQKTFVRLSGFWPLRVCVCVCLEGGGGGESVKKGKSLTKILFQKMLDEVLKSCKK